MPPLLVIMFLLGLSVACLGVLALKFNNNNNYYYYYCCDC